MNKRNFQFSVTISFHFLEVFRNAKKFRWIAMHQMFHKTISIIIFFFSSEKDSNSDK